MRSSRGEHSMPLETTPRSVRGASGSGRTGTREPGCAHGTRSPGGEVADPGAHGSAPPVPSSIRATQSVSESGWSRHVEDAGDDHPVQAVPRPQDALDLDPALGDELGELVRGQVGGRELAQPRQRRSSRRRPRTAPGTGRRCRRACGCRGSRSAAARPVRSRCRTRTPCTARCRTRSSPAPSGAPCPTPSSSIQPLPHTLQPTPSHTKHETPTSRARLHEREVRRARAARRRVSPNSAFAIASSVPFRSANVMPSSTARPST